MLAAAAALGALHAAYFQVAHTPRPAICRSHSASHRSRPVICADAIIEPDALMRELNSVPCFAILLEEEDKLYGTDDGATLVYTTLSDAQRVLAQLADTYDGVKARAQPVSLGAVARRAGLLPDDVIAEADESAAPATLVASPTELRNARQLCGAPRDARKPPGVPVFHVGAVRWRLPSGDEEELWPLFFRHDDVLELREKTPDAADADVQASTLDAVVAGLLGGAPDVAARPLLCAPLESVEFMRAAANSEEAS